MTKQQISNDRKDIAIQIAELVDNKQKAYGNAFEKVTEILKVLYPQGVPVYKYQDFLTVVRILDKICRISSLPATGKDSMGEEPWKDIMGYSLLAVSNEIKKNSTKDSF